MAKKDKNTEVIDDNSIVLENTMDVILSQGFSRYSKYVLQERAVPDVRDGLKPVQRRILYTMYLEGNTSSKPTRKCARTVGQVIGRFHPHGDTSVYEAMVRLSQDWKMRIPLLDFQGNNGSIDGDSAAAYRYTEARLSEISEQMVLDLNKDVVDMELNFDDQELEPTVLPGRFPNLLVNGSQGVAVGASTDIPPHNLKEVIDAIIYRINHKRATVEDLMQFVKGPDFPTGGIITNPKDLENAYKTGKGLIKLLSKTRIVEEKTINQIIIDEIPYGRDKSDLVASIDKMRFANNLDAILEVRDETDKDGIRIAIDVKKDADIENLLKFIISKNVITSSIKFNLLVIDHYRPRVLNLLEVIDCYIEHQIEILTRRSNYDLKKMKARLHIVEGLIKALSILDQVIQLIRNSKDKADAKDKLVNQLGFSAEQADALLMLQLYRLSNTDVTTLVAEKENLEATIKDLEDLLLKPERMNRLIASDLSEISKKYSTPRRTALAEEEFDLSVDKRALITKEETMVVFTYDGYFKRCQMRSYNASSGSLPGIKDGDAIKGIVHCYTTDFLLAFTNFGNYLFIPVYKIFDNKWKEEGKHINDIGSISSNEKIIGGVVVSSFVDNVSIALVSKKGQIKRTDIKEFEVSRISKPIRCFRLNPDDELVDVQVLTGNSDLLIVTSNGLSSLFKESDVPLVGIKAGGVKSISFGKDKAKVIGALAYAPEEERTRIVLVTKNHAARIIDKTYLVRTSRLGAKQALYKSFKSSPQECMYVAKTPRKSDKLRVGAVLGNHSFVEINLDEIKTQPIDSFLKENIELESDAPIINCFRMDVPIVDENLKTYQVEKIIKEVKPQDDEYEQLTLFDLVDDD